MAKRRTRKDSKKVKELMQDIPNYISGKKRDPHGISTIYWAAVAEFLYGKFYEAYVTKSEGGTDELGNRWKALDPSTVAKRPVFGQLGRLGLAKKQSGTGIGERTRGLLTPDQDAMWRAIYAKTVISLTKKGMSEGQAKNHAAKLAWNMVKKGGAKTKKDLLGNRHALIMRVTDTILESLAPATAHKFGYRPKKNQKYIRTPDGVSLGTTVEYARFHEGTRPPIPPNWTRWMKQAEDHALDVAVNRAMEVL